MEVLNPNEFVNQVKKYKEILSQRVEKLGNELKKDEGTPIPLELVKLDDIKDPLITILLSLHKKYINERKLPHLTAFETSRFLLDAKFVALAGVSALLRYEYNFDKDFGKLYSEKIGIVPDDSLYNNIIIPAIAGQGLLYDKAKTSVLDFISLEAGLPHTCLPYAVRIAMIYWKYFYPKTDIKDIISLFRQGKQDKIFSQITNKADQSDFKHAYVKINEFLSKTEIFVSDLIRILTRWNTSSEIDIKKFIENSNENIIYSFRDKKENTAILEKLLADISINKWKRINKDDSLLCYGEQCIEANKQKFNFNVSCHQTVSLDALKNIEYDKLVRIGNKALFKSHDKFNVYNEDKTELENIYPLKLKDQDLGYLWSDYVAPHKTLYIKKGETTITLHDNNDIQWNIKLHQYYDEAELEHSIRCHIPYLYLSSAKDALNTVHVVNTDSLDNFYPFKLNKYGIGWNTDIRYEIRNRKPGLIDIMLVNADKKERLKLEPVINKAETTTLTFNPYESTKSSILLKEVMLFGSNNPYDIKPSRDAYMFGDKTLLLFTVRELNPQWFNEAVNIDKIKSLKQWGDYHIYEIHWDDQEQPLIIDIDDDYQWIFEKTLSVGFQKQKSAKKKTNLEFCSGRLLLQPEDNQFFSLSDIKIKIISNTSANSLGNLICGIYYNDELLGQEKLETINKTIGKDVNNLIVEEEFIKYLSGINSDLPGRYEIFISSNYELPDYKFASFILNSFTFQILPQMHFEEVNKILKDNQQVQILYNIKDSSHRNRLIFDDHAQINASVARKKTKTDNIDPKDVTVEIVSLYDSIQINQALTELSLKYTPDVTGFKFCSTDKSIQPYISERIDYYNLDSTALIVFSRDAVTVNTQGKNIPFAANKAGITVISPLSSIFTEELEGMENEVQIKTADTSMDFIIEWNAKVARFNKEQPYFSLDDGLGFKISYCAPKETILAVKLEDTTGNPVSYIELWCDKVKNPPFARYNHKKKYIELVCDGLNWEDRIFTFKFNQSNLIGKELLILKGLYEDEPFSCDLIFHNATFNDEIVKLTKLIIKNPESSNNYYKRGMFFKEKEMWQLAFEDFNKALELGLKTKKAIQDIDDFKNTMLSSLINEDIKFLANNAKKTLIEQFGLEL